MIDILLFREKIASRFASLVTGMLVGFMSLGVVHLAIAQPERTGTLTIEITGFTSEEGQVRIAVFNAEEHWLETTAYAKILDVEGPTCQWVIEEVPYGEYGVVAFHDENGNGKNDRNFLGIPKEAYGFSNSARRRFGPAKWQKAKFAVATPTTEVEIKVK